jgi:oxaloacetate decarboxylase beta subunit
MITYLTTLLQGVLALDWRMVLMIIIGGVLIYLAIAHDFEPVLLLPIGFGIILANLPLTGITDGDGILGILYNAGIKTELFPLLIFIGVGAMTDFGPLLENPLMAFMGAAGQIGIYVTLLLALVFGFKLNEAASIGIIGAIDGPTAIYVSSKLAPELLGAIAVTAYSYMSLIPILTRPVIKFMTTKKERTVHMVYSRRKLSRLTRVLFPIVVTIVVSLLSPKASPLIATLMFGNLLREAACVEELSEVAQNEIANITTVFLGITVGATMAGKYFLQPTTLLILVLGLFAFIFDIAGGLLLGKLYYVLSHHKINPLIGAAGNSAFPMAARIVQREALKDDFENFILFHAMGANAAGQVGSVIAGGIVLAIMTSGLIH